MNQKILMPVLLLLCAGRVQAQEATWFKAEGTTYYEFRDGTPHSDILFYTKAKGTRMIKSLEADAGGFCLVPAAKDFRPDFAVNSKAGNDKGISGTGMSRAYGLRSFLLEQPELKTLNGSTVLSWDAAVPAEDIYFEVLTSTDGIDFRVADKILARHGEAAETYSYTDQQAAVFYKVNVVDQQRGLRYTSKVMLAEQEGMKLFPTATNDRFRLTLNAPHTNGTYTILNTTGQVLQQGVLESRETMLSVAALAAGAYFVVVQTGGTQLVSRVIKL